MVEGVQIGVRLHPDVLELLEQYVEKVQATLPAGLRYGKVDAIRTLVVAGLEREGFKLEPHAEQQIGETEKKNKERKKPMSEQTKEKIRKLLLKGELTQREIGEKFDCKQSQVSRIKTALVKDGQL